jgi:DNA-damage-inducible protein J
MAQAMVNFRMDEGLKSSMEQVCKEMGMSMTTAFTIFASKVSKDRRIPFDISADPDPFYSEANMNRLRKAIADVESGKAKLTEHELIEVEDK